DRLKRANMLAGLVALSFPPAGVVITGGALLGTTIGGAGIRAWAAALVGVRVPNSQLKQYEAAFTVTALHFWNPLQLIVLC
ncbi:MAG: hypothetical protein Q7T59_01610, partial [Candidatus Woesebacteria bacterium]|nr:hypothetical protein [Candidatus Woesebacteria bacterium]